MDVADLHLLWFNLRRAADVSEEAIDRALLEGAGIGLNWYIALRWLSRDMTESLPVTQSAIDVAVGLTPSGTSRLLSRIESAGLIVRNPSETDRRSMVIELTAAGHEALRRATPYFTEAIRTSLTSDTSTEEARELLRTLTRIGNGDDSAQPNELTQDLSMSGILTWHTVDAVATADAMVVRQALDPLIFHDAARFPSDEVIADLRAILIDMVRSIGSPDAFVDADVRFHTRMADMCPNVVLRNLYKDLIGRIASGVKYIDSSENDATGPYLETRLKIHADLIDAISRGDTSTIPQLAIQHEMRRVDAGQLAGP